MAKLQSPTPIDQAREVLRIEAEAISRVATRLDDNFLRCVETLIACERKVIVSGMGKSGLIGQKIAATLSSTGTPSFFLHPAEALHGDSGMISQGDVFIGLSKSGETDELLRVIPILRRFQNTIIAMTSNANSTLAHHADIMLDISVAEEACPLQIVPTASSTAMLALGDALAISVMRVRGVGHEELAIYHPAGNIGHKLLTRVEDVMHKTSLPIVSPLTSFHELIHVMTRGRMGLAVVVEDERVAGIITDGDLRRGMEAASDFHLLKSADLMTKSPKSIAASNTLAEAEQLMTKHKITSLLVTKGLALQGVVQIYDL